MYHTWSWVTYHETAPAVEPFWLHFVFLSAVFSEIVSLDYGINVIGAVIYAADDGRKSGKMWEIGGAWLYINIKGTTFAVS